MTNPNSEFKILRIDGSARHIDSVSRELADAALNTLLKQHPDASVIRRDLARGVPQLTADWVEANLTDPETRTEAQHTTLAFSDTLIDELESADAVVMAVPMYNFSIPASVKAWIDLVCRARRTFRYTESGPEGLLNDRPVYLVTASGGVPTGSPVDFMTDYLRHIFGFLGIRDVRVIAADAVNADQDGAVQRALMELAKVA